MIAFEEFRDMPEDFWAFVKYVSENLKYTKRGVGVKVYSVEEIEKLCKQKRILARPEYIQNVSKYSYMRADLLNNFVESKLMTAEQAKKEFLSWEQMHYNGIVI